MRGSRYAFRNPPIMQSRYTELDERTKNLLPQPLADYARVMRLLHLGIGGVRLAGKNPLSNALAQQSGAVQR
ncbi:hypothetical protein MRB53_000588 [Persea americana]|uniref:Uncharacterized protein n=1 Tax=Persea americana TaxID=3435 RepID=A0ACC2MPJ1_PERAE|nr:hypothetical protein MRB53_000588 [Persea americana]